jgi:hypothetical protein
MESRALRKRGIEERENEIDRFCFSRYIEKKRRGAEKCRNVLLAGQGG